MRDRGAQKATPQMGRTGAEDPAGISDSTFAFRDSVRAFVNKEVLPRAADLKAELPETIARCSAKFAGKGGVTQVVFE